MSPQQLFQAPPVNLLTQQPITNEELSQLAGLLNLQIGLEADLAALEEKLKQTQEKLNRLQLEEVPTVMDKLGLRQLMLNNGAIVKLGPFYSCSLSDKDPEMKQRGLAWLRANGFSAIIKNEVKVPIPTGQDKFAAELKKWLQKRGAAFSAAEQVHNATLKSFMAERIESGKPFPMDVFKGFAGKKATIELPK